MICIFFGFVIYVSEFIFGGYTLGKMEYNLNSSVYIELYCLL
jgi:hypothetical protein